MSDSPGVNRDTWFDGFLAFVGKLWPLIALLVAFGSVLSFAINLDRRIESLERRLDAAEKQVHTLTVAPAIATGGFENDTSGTGTLNDPRPKNGQPGGFVPDVIANPVADACTKLADQITKDMEKGSFTYADYKRDMLKQLGCLPIPASR